MVFYILSRGLSLELTSAITLLALLVLSIYRKIKGQTGKYAFVGFLGILISIGFSLLSGDAIHYYLPDLVMTGLIVVLCVGSLVFGRPLAALMSHLTRGWPIEWYMRQDIVPAYNRVTIFWSIYFAIRFLLQGFLYFQGDITGYFVINTLLGMPMNIIILIISYVYGVTALKKLSGPSVEEFIEKKNHLFKDSKVVFKMTYKYMRTFVLKVLSS